MVNFIYDVNAQGSDANTNDTYYGTSDHDYVYLYGGNDVFIDIADGDDNIYDVMPGASGRTGNDVVSAGIGNDTVYTNLDSRNTYYGGTGADFLYVGYSESAARVDLAWGTAQNSAFGLVSQIGGFENIWGSDHNDVLYGDGAANTIYGMDGDDLMDGRSGHDEILGYEGSDRAFGGAGMDTVYGGNGNDFVYGEENNDIVNGNAGDDRTSGGDGNDYVLDQGGNDTLYGDGGNDFMRAGDDNDRLFGGIGSDEMYGQSGNDTLEGGAGGDVMSGGAGIDRFVFRAVSDSSFSSNSDYIADFARNADKIDLSAIDANTSSAGNQVFRFIGNTSSFSGAGQVRTALSNGDTIVLVNTDADSAAELAFYVVGNIALTSTDFIL